MNMNQTFNALLRESTFTKEVLCAGATQIRKANYSTPGVYAQAFAALSLGLERIGKLCLMLDHYIENNGDFPDFDYMKKKIGHKLDLLHQQATEIAERRNIEFHFLNKLNHPAHQAILQVLHDYADGDRYSNINILVGAKQKNDPISAWSSNVDEYIFANIIGQKRKLTINKNANQLHEAMSRHSVVRHIAETGEIIDNYFDASFRGGKFDAVAPYRQLYVLQIIRYWVELLLALGNMAQSLNHQEIPFLNEIFGGFYNEDSFLKSRKTWNF
jgi:hypothetical protein